MPQLYGFTQALATKIVQVQLGKKGQSQAYYKVMNSPPGFVNHFTSLATMPNTALTLKEGMPLGEHNLVLTITKPVKEGKQLLLHYGSLCGFGKSKGKKRAAGAASSAGRKKRARVRFGQQQLLPGANPPVKAKKGKGKDGGADTAAANDDDSE